MNKQKEKNINMLNTDLDSCMFLSKLNRIKTVFKRHVISIFYTSVNPRCSLKKKKKKYKLKILLKKKNKYSDKSFHFDNYKNTVTNS